VSTLSLIAAPDVQAIIAECPVEHRESVELRVAEFAKTLTGDDSENLADIEAQARALVNDALVARLRQEWGVVQRQQSELNVLQAKYDKIVWHSVWTNLKDSESGTLSRHLEDARYVAEDLHSEAWIKIREQFGNFREGKGSSFSGWAWKVTQNVVLDYKRREARRAGIAPMTTLTVTLNDGRGVTIRAVALRQDGSETGVFGEIKVACRAQGNSAFQRAGNSRSGLASRGIENKVSLQPILDSVGNRATPNYVNYNTDGGNTSTLDFNQLPNG